MNAGHFEQLSDCWSSEQQPATYYRTTAARARRLQADATTSRVKQYLDKMIAHCEGFAGKAEPAEAASRLGPNGRPNSFILGRVRNRWAGFIDYRKLSVCRKFGSADPLRPHVWRGRDGSH